MTSTDRPETHEETHAEFADAHTLRFRRFYAAPATAVWHAVTDSESLNVWLYPVSEVDPREGGVCSFSWGAPDAGALEGRVLVFDAPRRVRYSFPNDSDLQFDLAPVEGGTELTFTQVFGPEWADPNPNGFVGQEAEKHTGPVVPWRSGMLAGYHLNLAFLTTFLTDAWPPERVRSESRRCVEGTRAGEYTAAFEAPEGEWERLVDVYFDLVTRTYPGERPHRS